MGKVVPPGSARVLAKLESANPTGSMKDRMAVAAIRGAEARGDLHPDTAHSIHGTARSLRAHRPGVRVVAVEPAESAVLSGGPTGSHRIEGTGVGFLPPLWEPAEVDAIEQVSSEEAMAMSRRLAREEGIFCGTSSGGNMVAALRVAEQLGPDATVATIMVDSGFRYLGTGLY